jgi:uncharacterized protein YuzE
MVSGVRDMKIYYDGKADLLYIRFDEEKHQIVNKRVTEDIVLDIEEDDKIIGIEILDASKHINLSKVLPIEYKLLQREA